MVAIAGHIGLVGLRRGRVLAVDGASGSLHEAVHPPKVCCGSAMWASEQGDRGRKGLVLQPLVHRPLVCESHMRQPLARGLRAGIIVAARHRAHLALQDCLRATQLPHRCQGVLSAPCVYSRVLLAQRADALKLPRRTGIFKSPSVPRPWGRCGGTTGSIDSGSMAP